MIFEIIRFANMINISIFETKPKQIFPCFRFNISLKNESRFKVVNVKNSKFAFEKSKI